MRLFTDTQVKPIIGDEIEELPELEFKTDQLSFTALSADEVKDKIDSPEIENFLTEIYTAIASNGTTKEKLNVLTYFESLIKSSNTANRLINSAFVILLIKMLSQINISFAKLKMRICSIFGQLIRHATVIQNDLAESEICKILCETCANTDTEVRKRAVAALGEYLFYAATQLDEENADEIWAISNDAIETIFNQLSLETEEITKFYATKTIENITAQSLGAGVLFATLDIATALLGIFNSTSSEKLRTSAAVSISHICKLNPSIFPTIFESITCVKYCSILSDSPQRIQQAFLTMLNIALTNPYPKLNDYLMEEQEFKKAMHELLEHSYFVIRGKCILTVLLLFKANSYWIILVDDFRFYSSCDRMSRDYSKYIQY